MGAGMPFGILRDVDDLKTIMHLRGIDADVSPNAWKAIDKFLDRRAKDAVADIKTRLGAKSGRPVDTAKHIIWSFGASLRENGNSWQRITQKLDPGGYAKDRKGAIDRMRLGIQAVLKTKQLGRKVSRKPHTRLPL